MIPRPAGLGKPAVPPGRCPRLKGGTESATVFGKRSTKEVTEGHVPDPSHGRTARIEVCSEAAESGLKSHKSEVTR
jgi:hypothetical protein